MSARLSKKGVLEPMMWNSTCPIGVAIKADPIDEVDPIPNWTLIAPPLAVLSLTWSVVVRWNA
jgi:hypothetical protein